MKAHSRICLSRFTTGLAFLAAAYGLVAGTYGITRWLTLRELNLASEIESDTKIIAALVQMVVAGLCSAVCFGISAYTRISRRDEDAG
ncbi:MAG: hypothetical protein EPO07_10860 [Verrucomicrobia bacterium]|nr:MAG: hypothetical protein EPO07_10860 [Verrucomicrobiota bacterium]